MLLRAKAGVDKATANNGRTPAFAAVLRMATPTLFIIYELFL
jgi:hypothetical protein